MYIIPPDSDSVVLGTRHKKPDLYSGWVLKNAIAIVAEEGHLEATQPDVRFQHMHLTSQTHNGARYRSKSQLLHLEGRVSRYPRSNFFSSK
jgi:hypothetical protein